MDGSLGNWTKCYATRSLWIVPILLNSGRRDYKLLPIDPKKKEIKNPKSENRKPAFTLYVLDTFYCDLSCGVWRSWIDMKYIFSKKLMTLLFYQYFLWLWNLKYSASQPNHTSYRKFCFSDFVQKSSPCNMDIIIFDLRGYEGC